MHTTRTLITLVLCGLLATPALALGDDLVDLAAGSRQKVLLPVLVDGQQYVVGFAYTFDGNAPGSVLCIVLDPRAEQVEPTDPRYGRAVAAARALFTAIGSKLDAALATASQGTTAANPVGLLGTESDRVDNPAGGTSDLNVADQGALPNGEPIRMGSRVIALAHRVQVQDDGTVLVSVTLPQGSRTDAMTLMRSLAVNPRAYITTNGTTSGSGSVRTLKMDRQTNADGTVTHYAMFQVTN